MSYATSLLMAYPPPYGPSTLLSDDLVRHSSLGAYYDPLNSYRSTSRLPSDSFQYDHIGLGSSVNYHSPSYPNWQRDPPGQASYSSNNHIREYSDSFGAASSMTRSIDGNKYDHFPNYDRNSHLLPIWSPRRRSKPVQEEKPVRTHRSLPKSKPKTPIEELKKISTPPPPPPSPPPPPPREPINSPPPEPPSLPRDPTVIETNQESPSINVQAWVNETKVETPKDEKVIEEGWTNKIDQLHATQAQREKEKTKALRALPDLPKRNENKSMINDSASVPRKSGSYFDSLFNGNYVRKTSTNQEHLNSSYQQRLLSKNDSLTKPKTTILPKYSPPKKPLTYEPPVIKKSELITTWKRPIQKNTSDTQTPRENMHNDVERYREALQKFRLDRTEQEQREMNKSTAKRLNYSNYVRRSTREHSLRNPHKPSPWTDFFDMKKGNLYSLNKEEKKDLYNQSRSYSERIRYRNYVLHQDSAASSETTRSQRRSIIPFPTLDEEPQSTDEASEEPSKKDEQINSKTSESPPSSKSTKTIRPSDDENLSDVEQKQQPSKNNSRTPSSSVLTTTTSTNAIEHTDDIDGDSSSIQEKRSDKTFDNTRHKKR